MQVAFVASAEDFLGSDRVRSTECLVLNLRMPRMDGLRLQQRLVDDGHKFPTVVVWASLRWASLVGRLLGEAGCRAITKVLSLVLAAIAATVIRRGVMSALTR